MRNMGFLIDTDVLSESSNPSPNERVMAWLDAHDHEIHLSTISLGEIVKGIELLPAGKRRREIADWFDRLARWAGPRLLPPTADVMHEWGRLCGRQEKKGRRLPVLDSLIAATARFHDLTVATRNSADYPPDVRLFNPWED